MGEQNRSGMCLKPGDGLGFSSLANHINSLSNANRNWEGLTILVEGDQHSGLDGRRKAVKKVVGLAQDGGLDVQEADNCCQKSSDGYWGHQLENITKINLVTIKGVKNAQI